MRALLAALVALSVFAPPAAAATSTFTGTLDRNPETSTPYHETHSVPAAAGDVIGADLFHNDPRPDLRFSLKSPSGRRLRTSTMTSGSSDDIDSYTVPDGGDGTYQLSVWVVRDTGSAPNSYILQVDVNAQEPNPEPTPGPGSGPAGGHG